MRFSLIILFLIVSACATSCNKKNNVVKKLPRKSFSELHRIVHKDVSNHLNAKVKIKTDENYFGVSNLSAKIEMLKDSLIWISISANIGLSLEVGRVLITPDSLKILNKFGKTYYPLRLNALEKYMPIDMEFSDIQDLLFGIPLYTEGLKKRKIEHPNYILFGDDNEVILNFPELQAIMQSVLHEPSNSSLDTTFDEFYSENTIHQFPLERHYVLKANQTYGVSFSFSKIDDSNQQNFSFKIPEHYKVVHQL